MTSCVSLAVKYLNGMGMPINHEGSNVPSSWPLASVIWICNFPFFCIVIRQFLLATISIPVNPWYSKIRPWPALDKKKWLALRKQNINLIAVALFANKKPNLFFLPQFKCFYWQPLFELVLVSKEFASDSRSMFFFCFFL